MPQGIKINRKVELGKFLNTGKSTELFLDIETLFYNKKAKNPSDFKNKTYSVAISKWICEDENNLELSIYRAKDFHDLFEYFIQHQEKKKHYKIVIHNGNKYDNHFMLTEFKDHFGARIQKHLNKASKKAKSLKPELALSNKELKALNIGIAESRVKSKTNLDLMLQIGSTTLEMIDSFPKVQSKLADMGDKLCDFGLMPEEYNKTTLQYDKFDFDGSELPHGYIDDIYNNLDEDDNVYIDNDVISLAYLKHYYSSIFEGFDWNKVTLSQNIGEYYTVTQRDEKGKATDYNVMGRFQLYNKIDFGDDTTHIKYTDYQFSNGSGLKDENGDNLDNTLYAYLKSFYRGGLNFYNEKYVAKTIKGHFFSIDINSSYPFSMYFGWVPTYLHEAVSYEKQHFFDLDYQWNTTDHDIITDKRQRFTTWRVNYKVFNYMISGIKSRIIKQMLVKYYNNTSKYVNINTNTLNIINLFSKSKITRFPVYSYTIWDCEPFGSKEVIKELYTNKTNGKAEKEVVFDEMMNATELDHPPLHHFTPAQYAQYKILLNGIYGIPALRAFFNRFEYQPDDDNYKNYENDNENTERNIMFSVYVTSLSLLNLLYPLSNLQASEIDKYFIYADTDSLYLDYRAKAKMPESMFDPYRLGAWDIEHYNITQMHVLNHKKYAYETYEEKKGVLKKRIEVRSGGINKATWNTAQPFESFVKNQFHEGHRVTALRSILNKQGTVTLYNGSITMEKGTPYPTEYSEEMKTALDEIIQDIRANIDENEDSIYYETPLGAISESEIFQKRDIREGLKPIESLISLHSLIASKIKSPA